MIEKGIHIEDVIDQMGLIAFSQQCYQQMSDISGTEFTAGQISDLEQAACDLIDSLPQAYQDSFAVLDYGFYLHNRSMDQGVEDIWPEVIQAADAISPYYLLLGRVPGREREVKVELKMPGSLFDCYESSYIARIHFEIKRRVQNQGTVTGQIEAMEYLTEEVRKAKVCCEGTTNLKSECVTCSWTKSEIKDFFSLEGFDTTKTMISSIIHTDTLACVCENDKYASTYTSVCEGNNCVEIQTRLDSVEIIGLSTTISEIQEELRIMAEIYKINGIDFYACVTDNSIFCEDPSAVAFKGTNVAHDKAYYQGNFNASTIGVWIHLQAISDYEVEAYVKVKGNQGRTLFPCDNGVNPNIDCVHSDCSYCDRLQWVFNKLGTFDNIYTRSVHLYCKSNDYDLLFYPDFSEYNSAYAGTTTAIRSMLKSKISTVTIGNLDPSLLDASEFCQPKGGYLQLGNTILHECAHAEMSFFVLKTAGKTVADKYKFCSFKDLNEFYTGWHEFKQAADGWGDDYGNIIEHYAMHRHYMKELAEGTWKYNDNYGQWVDYTFLLINDLDCYITGNSGPYCNGCSTTACPLTLSEYETLFDHSFSELIDMYIYALNLYSVLEEQTGFPCE
jgi:hypothetical protein